MAALGSLCILKILKFLKIFFKREKFISKFVSFITIIFFLESKESLKLFIKTFKICSILFNFFLSIFLKKSFFQFLILNFVLIFFLFNSFFNSSKIIFFNLKIFFLLIFSSLDNEENMHIKFLDLREIRPNQDVHLINQVEKWCLISWRQ